jgi:hypothetical protein
MIGCVSYDTVLMTVSRNVETSSVLGETTLALDE